MVDPCFPTSNRQEEMLGYFDDAEAVHAETMEIRAQQPWRKWMSPVLRPCEREGSVHQWLKAKTSSDRKTTTTAKATKAPPAKLTGLSSTKAKAKSSVLPLAPLVGHSKASKGILGKDSSLVFSNVRVALSAVVATTSQYGKRSGQERDQWPHASSTTPVARSRSSNSGFTPNYCEVYGSDSDDIIEDIDDDDDDHEDDDDEEMDWAS
jgi:hypothetical protein